jgi:hypothetical protein
MMMNENATALSFKPSYVLMWIGTFFHPLEGALHSLEGLAVASGGRRATMIAGGARRQERFLSTLDTHSDEEGEKLFKDKAVPWSRPQVEVGQFHHM